MKPERMPQIETHNNQAVIALKLSQVVLPKIVQLQNTRTMRRITDCGRYPR